MIDVTNHHLTKHKNKSSSLNLSQPHFDYAKSH